MDVFAGKKSRKKLSDRQAEYVRLRLSGQMPREAFKSAGYKSLDTNSAPYRVERSVARFLITRDDVLRLGRRATKKIFEDYLKDRPEANASVCVRLIAMQQGRIDPVIRRTEIKGQIEHEVISPDLRERLDAAYENYLLVWEESSDRRGSIEHN